jgi:hypothetical protein
MQNPDREEAIREVIRHWSRLTDLADFAILGHGFADSNGGFGVQYPGDLDEYDREVDGIRIPAGSVQIYGYWGPPDGYCMLVSELSYLDALSDSLSEAGHLKEAERVKLWARERRGD